jgi:hypothetical protein
MGNLAGRSSFVSPMRLLAVLAPLLASHDRLAGWKPVVEELLYHTTTLLPIYLFSFFKELFNRLLC